MTTLNDAVSQMRAAGMPDFPPGHPRTNTGQIIRYGPKKRAWYRLYEHQGRTGRTHVSGAYGMWGAIEAAKIESDYEGMDATERARIEKQMRAAEAKEREKRESRARFAAARARKQWLGAAKDPPDVDHYLKRKGLPAERGLKFLADGTVLVPMLRYDKGERGELVGLQKIAPDGAKRFNAGMSKQGAACRLGPKPAAGAAIMIAEGLATALSIREGTGKRAPVFVAFDCYNVKFVAEMLRKLFPTSPILICADDDFATEGNPGVTCAERAAERIGNARAIKPVFAERGERNLTDFNDLHQAEGLEAVGRQVHQALDALGGAAGGGAAKKRAKATSGPPIDWNAFHERFTFIYPTDTAFDHDLGELVKISNLRLMFGKGAVEFWLQSERRRTVNLSDVVFDPRGKADLKTVVNLFRGIKMQPSDKGSCRRLLDLLYFLCGEDPEASSAPVSDWVLKWIAYQLQHLGAKMQTAVVMFGGEGTGKNLLWGAIAKIFGEYGTLITQTELESPYNAWLSKRLFIIANEVVSRQELRHHVGRLKNLVTEPMLPISEKYLPLRYEANHANLVFLANELEPLRIAPDDRRYMVIRTPRAAPADFYKTAAGEVAAGGVEALYRYLLDYDCAGFNEHSKPLLTAAKVDLIELGLSSTQLFWQQMHDGLLPLPYCPAFVHDCYRAYVAWCARTGVKQSAQETRFSHEFMSMNGVARRVMRVPDPDVATEELIPAERRPQRRVFIMGVRPEDISESWWIRQGAAEFRAQLKAYVGERAGAAHMGEQKWAGL